jgi:hypothetical protein
MTQQTTADEARIERLAALNDRLIAENARLRRIEEAAERVCGNDMAGIVEDGAWVDLRAALGMEVCPT